MSGVNSRTNDPPPYSLHAPRSKYLDPSDAIIRAPYHSNQVSQRTSASTLSPNSSTSQVTSRQSSVNNPNNHIQNTVGKDAPWSIAYAANGPDTTNARTLHLYGWRKGRILDSDNITARYSLRIRQRKNPQIIVQAENESVRRIAGTVSWPEGHWRSYWRTGMCLIVNNKQLDFQLKDDPVSWPCWHEINSKALTSLGSLEWGSRKRHCCRFSRGERGMVLREVAGKDVLAVWEPSKWSWKIAGKLHILPHVAARAPAELVDEIVVSAVAKLCWRMKAAAQQQ